ncbi:hypothetical protein ERICIII_04875 (plasmid) [Paenibacillus larvae subsp. larvae]|uniref:Uncharacterized protein n=1 Tax=Paenibacillus larvae subsp. larvae TaxID=147375 RepID=A0A2L1U7G4_9BACL|nr:hypothetical protein ERICIII_04875 [Paenibacillus larvae subsp. larvae]
MNLNQFEILKSYFSLKEEIKQLERNLNAYYI